MKFPESGRGLGHVTPTIFGSTVGYPSDSLASCLYWHKFYNPMLPLTDLGSVNPNHQPDSLPSPNTKENKMTAYYKDIIVIAEKHTR